MNETSQPNESKTFKRTGYGWPVLLQKVMHHTTKMDVCCLLGLFLFYFFNIRNIQINKETLSKSDWWKIHYHLMINFPTVLVWVWRNSGFQNVQSSDIISQELTQQMSDHYQNFSQKENNKKTTSSQNGRNNAVYGEAIFKMLSYC